MPINDDFSAPVAGGSTPEVVGSGSFVVGTVACFFFSFTDLSGNLYDPSEFSIEIDDPDGTTVHTGDGIDKIRTGEFGYTWTIPSNSMTGTYILRLTYIVETLDGPSTEVHTERFVVVERGQGSQTFRQVASRSFLESLIGYSQRIPIWHETVRFNKARTRGKASFPRWNQSAGVELYINGDLQDSGYAVNYLRGFITFNTPIAEPDEVLVSYNFRWFTDDELDEFIEQGVNILNAYPPHSVYGIGNVPDRWIIAAEYAAASMAIMRWMMDITFQEPAKIFGGMDRASDVFGHYESLKKNYEDWMEKILENKKFGPYAGLTKSVTVPEYTLPGGRCLSRHSLITYTLENDQKSTSKNEPPRTDTIEKIYELFEQGMYIQVLSDNDGKLEFAPVSKVWKSGIKPLLKIEDNNNNSVEVSEEHIMFVNGDEIAAKEIKIGDRLTINHNEKIVQSKVTKISNSTEEETFDIEVPSTENLFANDIKCHNSRWFRYLFKGAMILFPLITPMHVFLKNFLV